MIEVTWCQGEMRLKEKKGKVIVTINTNDKLILTYCCMEFSGMAWRAEITFCSRSASLEDVLHGLRNQISSSAHSSVV